jgi:hypothetical protein
MAKMLLPEDNDVIKALSPDRCDESLRAADPTTPMGRGLKGRPATLSRYNIMNCCRHGCFSWANHFGQFGDRGVTGALVISNDACPRRTPGP